MRFAAPRAQVASVRLGVVAALALLSAGLGTSTATAQEDAPYVDIPADAYYAVPVRTLDQDGVFAGTLCDDGFCPGDPIDRKTMAVWTVRVLDGDDPPAVSETRFDDVDADGFHARFIERMAELGVTTGCGDGSGFCPDRNVTRAQMAAFLSRAYDLPERPDPGFSDVASDAWYAADVAALAASKITVGCGDGTGFCPGSDTTRGQMATFLWRAENPNWRADDTEPPLTLELNPAMEGGGIIAAGGQHSCQLRSDQTITCWGGNLVGESEAPAGKFTAVSAGAGYSCGIRTDQTITCWGSNWNGESEAPTGKFAAVSAGNNGSCGIRVDQTMACWGTDRYNYGFLDPQPGKFTAVSTTYQFSCGLRTDQTITCWGDNHWPAPSGKFTALAHGTFPSNYVCGIRTDKTIACSGPSWFVSRVPAGNFTAIAGGDFACGLRTDRTITCWGGGTIGDAPSEEFIAIAGGSGHVCGIRVDQTAACWGQNDIGQTITPGKFIAVSVDTSPSITPILCGLRDDQTVTCLKSSPRDPRAAPTGKFTAVSAGFGDLCGIRTDQSITCWGKHWKEESEAPTGKFTAVSARSGHLCGIRTDQSITCWGIYEAGELYAPTGKFTAVSATYEYSCGIRTDQSITCWGIDEAGESYAPTGKFTAVSARSGSGHSCGIRTDQSITCWGLDEAGEPYAPTGKFTAVSAADMYSCGIRTDQSITCWSGSRAITVWANRETPRPLGMSFTSVSVGDRAVCGVTTDHSIICSELSGGGISLRVGG